MKIDKSIIKELSDYLDEFNLAEIEINQKDTKIKISKNNLSINHQPVATSANANKTITVNAPKPIIDFSLYSLLSLNIAHIIFLLRIQVLRNHTALLNRYQLHH